jgi:hypothetical protein
LPTSRTACQTLSGAAATAMSRMMLAIDASSRTDTE